MPNLQSFPRVSGRISALVCALFVIGALLGVATPAQAASTASPSATGKRYPLERLHLLRGTLLLLRKHYVDPTQFKAPIMYKKALLRLEQSLAGFQVTFGQDSDVVQLGPHKKTLPHKRFFGLFDVWTRLRPVGGFLAKHYKGKISFADIEHLMVMGMMSTLDKQTQIVNPKHYRNRRSRKKLRQGKIGAVLRWKQKKLWIVSVASNGPADLAGLTGGDQIVRINGQLVKGGSLWSWIQKITGLRGTRVALHIARKGWSKPRRFVLIRAAVKTPNVTGHILPGKIGYVRLRQFARGSALAIREQLARIRRDAGGTILGLILDLRQNPGGLVREAVAICSLFVDKGEVTTYAGANTKRKTYNVSGTNLEERYPLLVLLNGYSASASELLSGALQNHKRAIVMGRQSYGKGTVQVTGPLRMLGLYFRITIAQYMIPGNQSIQAVGVTPDIALQPVRISPNSTRYYSNAPIDQAKRRKRWPGFLLQNLDDPDANKSLFEIRYLPLSQKQSKPTKRRKKPAKAWQIDPTHPLGPDLEVWLARYLLAHAKSGRANIFYEQIKRPLLAFKRQQERILSRAIQKQGLNWQLPARLPSRQPTLQGKLELIGQTQPLQVGKPFRLRLTITNKGKATAYRTHAILYAGPKTLRYRELLFGRIPPGKRITRELKLTLPTHERSQVETITFKMYHAASTQSTKASLLFSWKGKPRPQFAISTVVQDPSPDGNGDGRLQPGEQARILFFIKNIHNAPSSTTVVRFSPSVLRLSKETMRIGPIPPNQARSVVFRVKVPDNAKPGRISSLLSIYDLSLLMKRQHRITLRVAKTFSGLPQVAKGWLKLNKATSLTNSPDARSPVIATIPAGAHLPLLQKWGAYYQVKLPSTALPPTNKRNKTTSKAPPAKGKKSKKRPKATYTTKALDQPVFAWIAKKHTSLQTAGGSHAGLAPVYHLQAPSITLKGLTEPAQTKAKQLSLQATIQSTQGIRDVYVLRGKRKIFYKAVQFDNPKGNKRITPTIVLPLNNGPNTLKLVVRTAKSQFHKIFHVTRIQ